jgi:hypothetical protein
MSNENVQLLVDGAVAIGVVGDGHYVKVVPVKKVSG